MAKCLAQEHNTVTKHSNPGMGVARIFQRGGHTDSYRGYSSDCYLNIVSCLLTRRLTKGGGGHGHPRTPLATPMPESLICGHHTSKWVNCNRMMYNCVFS